MKIIRRMRANCTTCLNQAKDALAEPCLQCALDHAARLGWTKYLANFKPIESDPNILGGAKYKIAVISPEIKGR